MGAAEVLATHRISLKTIRRPNGAVDHTYSIQFTYERGKKKQVSGKTEEEVRGRVYEFSHVSALTFRELYEKWQNDGELTGAEKEEGQCRQIFYTSAVYAFKAECDMPSVASIIGYNKTMEMFRNPEKFDLYERKKSRSVNSYFDELYFGEQREE